MMFYNWLGNNPTKVPTVENIWNRDGTTISPTIAGDDVALKAGEILSVLERLGIGTSAPGHKLEIITDETINSAIHFGERINEGAYFTSTEVHQLAMSAGMELVNGYWTARGTEASLLNFAFGGIGFYANAGLLDGEIFSPNIRMAVDTAGDVGIGILEPEEKLHVIGNVKAADGIFSGVIRTPIVTLIEVPIGAILWDMSLVQKAKFVLIRNTSIFGANLIDGVDYTLRLIQGGGGSFTVNWSGNFKWPNGAAPTLTTAPGALDIFSFSCDGARLDNLSSSLDSK